MFERFALFINISISGNSITDNLLFLFRNIQVDARFWTENQCEKNYCIHKKFEFIQSK